VHTTASNNQDPNKTARYHCTPSPTNHISKKGAPGLCYHDFITKNGTIFHCNDYNEITWHTKGQNGKGIGVTLAFRGQTGELPVAPQFQALIPHLAKLCLLFKVLPRNVKGHREASGMAIFGKGPVRYKKKCPGMGVDMNVVRHLVTIRLQQLLKDHGYYRGIIDGAFGKNSRAALQAFSPAKVVVGG
tara:strand:+ start:1551 stop:2114 length:564 start_codon:yes stop_codon:yes gene_type:complete